MLLAGSGYWSPCFLKTEAYRTWSPYFCWAHLSYSLQNYFPLSTTWCCLCRYKIITWMNQHHKFLQQFKLFNELYSPKRQSSWIVLLLITDVDCWHFTFQHLENIWLLTLPSIPEVYEKETPVRSPLNNYACRNLWTLFVEIYIVFQFYLGGKSLSPNCCRALEFPLCCGKHIYIFLCMSEQKQPPVWVF